MSRPLFTLCLAAFLLCMTACQRAESESAVDATAAPDTAASSTYAAELTATRAAPTARPTLTFTPDPFPTPVIGAIYIAEQRFERGWMFWLQPNQQIWLLTVNDSGGRVWSVYEDSFVEGDAEYDAEISAPEGMQQPIRGFGKLWRDNPDARADLGWALEDELGHTTRYEYHHGGSLDENNNFLPGFGYHLVESANGDTFRFNEDNHTWEVAE